ncbi:MAG: ribosome assembly factor SBDS [Nanoarchaeota archaeon]|nr:ribosome assembly factor SBDS [Nanoarchaeota archaeon]
MTQTTARVKRNGKKFEILVDLDEAMKIKRGDASANINSAVMTEYIFHNLKSGEHVSDSDLEKEFGTTDITKVAEKIIKSGEVVRTTESMRGEHGARYKQVVDFLVSHAVSPEGRPYTGERIMKALIEANVNVKNKSVDSQITEIIDDLSKILPIKLEMKRVKLTIPAIHTGKAYGIIKEFMVEEDWLSNGDLQAIVSMPTALIFDFYDRLNGATSGAVMSEELKG